MAQGTNMLQKYMYAFNLFFKGNVHWKEQRGK